MEYRKTLQSSSDLKIINLQVVSKPTEKVTNYLRGCQQKTRRQTKTRKGKAHCATQTAITHLLYSWKSALRLATRPPPCPRLHRVRHTMPFLAVCHPSPTLRHFTTTPPDQPDQMTPSSGPLHMGSRHVKWSTARPHTLNDI